LQIFSISSDYTLSHKFAKHVDYVSGTSIVCIRPDNKIVAVGFWDGRVILFSWKKLRPLAILKEHKDTIHDIVYSSCEVQTYDTRYLMAITGKDGCISLWDIYK
jgi:WD40 repeat protein